jgi:hypothetical protein
MVKFDDGVLELMPHIISLAERISIDRYNRATYATAVRYRALVVYKPIEIRTISGEEAIARARIAVAPVVVNNDDTLTYLDSFPDIKAEHQITLPDGSQPVIISLEKNDGIPELNHLVIYT